MKYRFTYILPIIFILFALNAAAQLSIAPEAGFNLSGVKDNGNATDNNMRLTGKFGAILDLRLNNNFYLQPGLFYSMEGESVSDYVSANNYLELPVNVLYKIGSRPDRFFVGLGLYAGYALVDKLKSGKDHENMPIGTAKQDDLKPFDIGANIRIGHELSNGLFLAGQYSMGFADTYPGDNYNEKNWVFSVTVGYLFHLKKKKEIVIPTTF
jgi:hypothetical protein